MKFRTSIPPIYQPDTVKSVMSFAWWPKRIGNVIVWLGRYETLYCYKVAKIPGIYNGQPKEWLHPEWIKVSEHVL